MGIYYALIAALLQGIGYTLLKKSFNELHSSVSFMFETIFGLIIWISYSLYVGIEIEKLPTVFFFALISAILSEAFVFFALSKGEISITNTIFSTYPIFTMIMSYVFLHERATLVAVLFLIVTIIGVLILALPSKFDLDEIKKKVYIIWPLVAAIAVGISDTVSKNVIDDVESSTFLFCLAIAQVPVSLVYLRLEKALPEAREVLRDLKSHKITVLSALFISTSMIFFWLAFENTLASIASPVTATQILFVLILSRAFLGYRPRFVEIGGTLITIAGIVGVGIFGA